MERTKAIQVPVKLHTKIGVLAMAESQGIDQLTTELLASALTLRLAERRAASPPGVARMRLVR